MRYLKILNAQKRQNGVVLTSVTVFLIAICVMLTINSKEGTLMEMKISNANQMALTGRNNTEEAAREGEQLLESLTLQEQLVMGVEQGEVGNQVAQSVDWEKCGYPSTKVPSALIAARFIKQEKEQGESLNDRPAGDDISYVSNFYIVNATNGTQAKTTEVLPGEAAYICDVEGMSNEDYYRDKQGDPFGTWEVQTIYSVDINSSSNS